MGKAVLFDTAVARYTDNQINDPLRLTIGEGSFLKNITSALGINEELPEEDTPLILKHSLRWNRSQSRRNNLLRVSCLT